MEAFAGVVLAGGAGRRLPGEDAKPSVIVGGRAMLARVVAALSGAGEVVVAVAPSPAVRREAVPDRDPGRDPVLAPLLDPPDARVTWVADAATHAGPVAGLAAALPHVGAPVTVVLAADLPLVDAGVVAWLRRSLDGAGPGAEAVVPVDGSGRRQHLAAAYRTAALRRALAAAEAAGRPWRDLLAGLRVVEVDPGPLSGRLLDVDTPEDLSRARMTAWSLEAAAALGTGLHADEVLAAIPPVLDVAKDVAHGVERPAAPVTTFLAGVALGRALAGDPAARAGTELDRLAGLVRATLATRDGPDAPRP